MKKNYFNLLITACLIFFFATHLNAQNSSPLFTSSPITGINDNETYSYSIKTTDADGDAIDVSTLSIPGWLTLANSSIYNVSTFAGLGTYGGGYVDGVGTVAQFSSPYGIAIDASNNIYVADLGNRRIRKISLAGVVSTLAGSTYGYLDGAGASAKFFALYGIAVDASGNVYVTDSQGDWANRVRKITPSGDVSTLAGSDTAGSADGTGMNAQFSGIRGVAVDASGNVYVADYGNARIRKITPAGEVTTFAGSSFGYADGLGIAAQFWNPAGVAVAASGNVYVADTGNQKIRKITPSGVVTTLAGSTVGFADGIGAAAQFNYPNSLTVDAQENVYVTDEKNQRIRKITSDGVVTTLSGSFGNNNGYPFGGFLNGVATEAIFHNPRGVVVDASGNVYVSDAFNDRIRRITPEKILIGDAKAHAGVYDININAQDNQGGNTAQNFTLTVTDVTPPAVSGLWPPDDGAGVNSSNLQINFSEDVKLGSGNILIKQVSDDLEVASIPVNGSEVSIDNIANKALSTLGVVSINISNILTLPSHTALYVEIPTGAFTDMSGNDFPGFSDKTSWNFSTDVVLGIETNIIKGFSMYPNPVTNVLNIKAQETIKNIQVFNLLGQQVVRKVVNDTKTSLDLSRLYTGTYFVKISTDKTTKSVKLFKN